MTKVRVLYVEDDPSLRAIMTEKLATQENLTITPAANSDEVFHLVKNQKFDVVMLDIALGPQSLSGIEIAHRLRREQPDLGIVFYSQYSESAAPTKVDDYFMGWSTVSKSGQIVTPHLADVLISTARGYSRLEATRAPALDLANPLSSLTPRQQEIMSLLSQGKDANLVAEELQLAPITVRGQLTKIYRTLIPDPKPGMDLRTMAILRYLRATRINEVSDFE